VCFQGTEPLDFVLLGAFSSLHSWLTLRSRYLCVLNSISYFRSEDR
jgi:hypothetical protein